MCELFAMSSLEPATVSISLEEFAKRGGLTGPHKDGWGVAFYQGPDVRIVRESSPASSSSSMQFVKAQNIRSRLVISHIRQATKGNVELRNTQPFSRELGGRMHLFAHNGDLEGIDEELPSPSGPFRSIGNTDSEYAFTVLMNRMYGIWSGASPPELDARLAVVTEFAAALRGLGPANFIYSDSEVLYIHGHKRSQTEGGEMRPPGLHMLCRVCPSRAPGEHIDGLEIGLSGKEQRVMLVASVPLTGEAWSPIGEAEILAIAEGLVLRSERM